MSRTIETLAGICEKYRFREKLLFVPSYAIGHQIGDHLARSGTPWINLRMTTTGGYAQEVAALKLSEAGLRLIDANERLLIVERLYRDHASSGTAGRYFKDAVKIPGILKCLADAVHEIRMSGLDAKDLVAEAFVVPEKGEELAWLLKTYHGFLKDHGLIDHAGLLHLAIDTLPREATKEKDRVVMALSDFPLSRLEKDLIRAVGRQGLIVVDHTRPVNVEQPKRFLEVNNNPLPEVKKDIDLMAWLFCPLEAPEAFGDGSVSVYHALGESNEVREVFRRILAEKIPLDDVEILVSKIDPYVSLVYEIAASLEIPTTFAGGVPITYTRPGRALLYYLRWLAEDFRSSCLRRLLSGGYLDLNGVRLEGERPSAGRAAALIREAAIGWGRERYRDRLDALEESFRRKASECKAEGEDQRAERAKQAAAKVLWLNGFIEMLFETVPMKDPQGAVPLEDLCKGAVRFLQSFSHAASELDGEAKPMLIDLLKSTAQAVSVEAPAEEAAVRLETMVAGLTVGASSPKPGHVHVAHYRSGGFSGRRHTYVLGLDQARFPGTMLEEPVVLDAERKQLSAALAAASEIPAENAYLMAKALASLEGKVTLSYSCRDLREDREGFPASIILNAYRLITLDRRGDYRALHRFLGDPVGFFPGKEGTPLNDWEWWLEKKERRFASSSVYKAYPDLFNGDQAEEARDSAIFGAYDGWICSASGAMDPVNSEMVLSCSRLESLAKCPFGFFLQNVLGVAPLDELEKDLSKWLDSIQRGALLHDVFYRFMETLKEKGERPNVKKHAGLLEAIAMEEVERWKAEVPPGSALAFDREIQYIKQCLMIFLGNEAERCETIEPCFFELSFGMKGSEKSGLCREEPVEIVLKGKRRFKLRGQIDRIDRCGEHEYEVWDYKTGSTWGFKEESYVNRGKQLQHALYAIAAETVLRERVDERANVVRAGYFFPSPKGEGRRIEKEQANRKVLIEVLEMLFALLQNGILPYSADKEPCKYCDYIPVCGGADVAVLRCKQKLEKDDKLAPLKRLMDHG